MFKRDLKERKENCANHFGGPKLLYEGFLMEEGGPPFGLDLNENG